MALASALFACAVGLLIGFIWGVLYATPGTTHAHDPDYPFGPRDS